MEKQTKKTEVNDIRKYEIRIGGNKGFEHPTETEVLKAVETICTKKGEYETDIREVEKPEMDVLLEIDMQLDGVEDENLLEAIQKVCSENGLEEYDQREGQLCYSAKYGKRRKLETEFN